MKSVVALLRYCVIVFSVVFLSSYAFAQQAVQLEGVVARIPSARILDWEGLIVQVNGEDGWQEQALEVNDTVCCPDDSDPSTHNYVVVALNRSATNLATLQEGTCLTINEADGSSADSVTQNSAEALFDLETLEAGSSFAVDTPMATVGTSGTTFNVIVFDGDGDPTTVANGDYAIVQVVEVSPGKTLTAGDKYPDVVLGDLDTYPLNSGDELSVIKGSPNVHTSGVITESTPCHSNPGKHLGQAKQEAGEIATKSRGKKKGFYKYIEEEEEKEEKDDDDDDDDDDD
jgi:hypothetical protein